MHKPVLVNEVIEYLQPFSGKNYIDATCGFAGHAEKILAKTGPKGKLLAIEQDPVAFRQSQQQLSKYGERVIFAQTNFKNLYKIVKEANFYDADGILFDLGPSTEQLKSVERGFSFTGSGPLDMRMDPTTNITAAKIVNQYPENEIFKILSRLGEEKYSSQITKKIIENRQGRSIKTTSELVEIIKKAIPPKNRFTNNIHFATNVFRGLRMAVNQELENLKETLPQTPNILKGGGRIAIISFHSLEDRIVKNFFRDHEEKNILKIIIKKPIVASEKEVNQNPSARSAKLRIAQKI